MKILITANSHDHYDSIAELLDISIVHNHVTALIHNNNEQILTTVNEGEYKVIA